VGAFWQEYDFRLLTDELLASGDVSGFNAEDNIIGRTSNTDIFAELYLPVTNSLGVTAGARYSDHNLAGSNTSSKLEFTWDLTDSIAFRGGYQRAVRAPNVGELFQPQVADNPDVTDPCNFDSGERAGASATQVEALCVIQGIPATSLATYKQSTDQVSAITGGNPNLQEETADTLTVGVVWQPDIAGGLQVSLDYYDIDIEDAIQFVDPSIVTSRCFNSDGGNSNYENSNFWCQKFGRSPTSGEIIDLLEIQENIGGLRTSGIDVQVDWGTSLGGAGELSLNFVATFVDEHAQQQLPGDPFVDFSGSIGDDEGEALPDMKGSVSAIWDFGNFSSLFRLSYLPSMIHEEAVITGSTDEAVCNCTGVSSITYVDVSTAWQWTDSITIRLGINNLTDEAPELYTPDQDSGTNASVYDVIGRRWYLSANFAF
jgi:outer membrane receptor protein involved in Fe transport